MPRARLPAHARLLIVALLLASVGAHAEAPPPVATGMPFAPPSHRHGLERRFAEANTSHDGQLTLAQARANDWHGVVANFTVIDAGGKGYVTLEDIHAFNKQRRAARRAATAAGE